MRLSVPENGPGKFGGPLTNGWRKFAKSFNNSAADCSVSFKFPTDF